MVLKFEFEFLSFMLLFFFNSMIDFRCCLFSVLFIIDKSLDVEKIVSCKREPKNSIFK